MAYDAHAYLGDNPMWSLHGLPVPLDADAWIDMMNISGIDGALVAPPGVGAKHDFKPDLQRIALGVERYPERLFGFCRIKPRKGEAALKDLRYWVRERGFKALKMNTLDDNYRLTNRDLLDPVIETSEKLGIPVYFHTGQESWESCQPSMVADIAVDFPNTTFILGHMGFGGVNGWPGASDQLLDAMKRASNTVTETAGVFHCKFIQDVIDEIGAERVLMGGNGPYQPIELPRIMFEKHMNKLSKREKELVVGKNLLRVLKIED